MGKGKQAGWATTLLVLGLVALKGFNRYQRLERSQAAQSPPPSQVQREVVVAGPVAPAASASPDQLFAAASPAVALIELLDRASEPITQGSGFFVSADGLLVTNFHVIRGGAKATVHCGDGAQFNVEGAVAVAPEADLALLKVNTRGRTMPYLALSMGDVPAVGSRVFAIGNPRGMTNTLSDGLVSATRQIPGFEGTLIQTSAPISPGSSGGPLLAGDGTVIGVTTAGLDDAQNVNFAVPAARVRTLLLAKGATRALSSLSPPRKAPVLVLDEGSSTPGKGSSTVRRPRPTLTDKPADLVAELLDRRDYTQAMSLLRAMAPEFADSAQYWFLLGRAQEEGFRNHAIAEDAYRRAITLQPNHQAAHERLASMLMARGRYTDAIATFRALAKFDPTSPAGYRGAGQASMLLGQHKQALAFYDWALKLAPASAELHQLRGEALCYLDRTDEAMAAFTTVLRTHPQWDVTLVWIGDVHLRMGRTADAKRSFQEVLRLYPTNARAHLQLGRIAELEGDLAGARASWEKALARDPRGPNGKAALELLQRSIGGGTAAPRR